MNEGKEREARGIQEKESRTKVWTWCLRISGLIVFAVIAWRMFVYFGFSTRVAVVSLLISSTFWFKADDLIALSDGKSFIIKVFIDLIALAVMWVLTYLSMSAILEVVKTFCELYIRQMFLFIMG